jgi:alpha-glucosidase
MTDVDVPPARIVDVDGRDPERTPMQWDATPNAGFTIDSPWLPLAPDAQRVNVASQRDDPSSMFSFYRRLIRLRRGSSALRAGSYRTLSAPHGVFAYVREAERKRLLIALNFLEKPQRIALPETAAVVLSTSGERAEENLRSSFELGPDEGLVAQLG